MTVMNRNGRLSDTTRSLYLLFASASKSLTHTTGRLTHHLDCAAPVTFCGETWCYFSAGLKFWVAGHYQDEYLHVKENLRERANVRRATRVGREGIKLIYGVCFPSHTEMGAAGYVSKSCEVCASQTHFPPT